MRIAKCSSAETIAKCSSAETLGILCSASKSKELPPKLLFPTILLWASETQVDYMKTAQGFLSQTRSWLLRILRYRVVREKKTSANTAGVLATIGACAHLRACEFTDCRSAGIIACLNGTIFHSVSKFLSCAEQEDKYEGGRIAAL